ncbi:MULTISPECIES: peptide-methionine (S)-S-oxide reductase [unclassified Pseudoalteromonas]|jgi:peptide-methionine (S)-S-oxide reductase|uniref:peptide-methionine (S)-S-oxide reductase n=1 Tax=unclassified Pseudoalteromonas TaxID=194690 RepID=UPI000C10B162|nr:MULTISPECIES: peptide-methionine (S)-S-oxide reductase [unclassified Pseudoalteromonas]MBL1386030.1 peptide-methionine (S)-S-oxide reductase [Colwellia sp.]TMS82832.1 methionine sulfoxide reductase A [Pseudoalteromonas sp. S554]UOB74789.1 peptide-methionine (S)-S-oxide reductase [Pseudoalteromonas sp. APM04]
MTVQQHNTLYFAGGCLWGVQEFMKHLPGVITTQAGRANGASNTTQGEYDGYAECVKVTFDSSVVSLNQLFDYFFEIIDPYSVNKQGVDEGPKYRTGIYSKNQNHLNIARNYINKRSDADKIAVKVEQLTNYVPSDPEHQDRLTNHPDDYCHIPLDLLYKYKL